MKKMATLMTLATVVMTTAGCSSGTLETGVLTIGLECAYAPFNWTTVTASEEASPIADTGLFGFGVNYCTGYDIHVAQYIADELGYTLQVRKISWDGLIPALQAGNIDAIIAGMTDTEERRLSVSFTAPYYASELVMLVKADGAYVDADGIGDFEGATLVTQDGTVQNDYIEGYVESYGVVHGTAYATYPDALLALMSDDNVDGVLAERPVAEALLAEHSNDVAIVEFWSVLNETYDPDFLITVSVAVRHEDTDLLEDIDEVLAGLSEETRLSWMNAATSAEKE